MNKWDYCQYLLSSPVNYTLTNMADHVEGLSHDKLNRYLRGEELSPALLWQSVEKLLIPSANGYLLFDDTVLDKRFGPHIEMTRQQWSGNAHAVIRGIGLVSCVYVNPELQQFWVMDYRVFDPDSDGKSKLDHMEEMLDSVKARQIAFQTVLMDSWYATKEMMLLIDSWPQESWPPNAQEEAPDGETGPQQKLFYCPLKSNRKVDDSGGARPYQRMEEVEWSVQELHEGKLIKIHGFPGDKKVKVFRVEVSTHRTDFIVTNDLSQNSTHATGTLCSVRWKIEQFHRELKQLTGIESCQCRKAALQRNHIHCALLVWTRLSQLAQQTQSTLYHLKHNLLKDFLIQQLKYPSINIHFA